MSWKSKLKRLSKVEKTFCVLLLVYLALALALPGSLLVPLLEFVLFLLGLGIVFRYVRIGFRNAIWRLRNRLLATYLFIAVVPVFLILVLAGLGGYALISQLAVYLAVSDLDRRSLILRDIAGALAEADTRIRPEVIERVAQTHRRRFPELAVITHTAATVQHWPPGESSTPPPDGWKESNGVVERKGHFYLWSHVINGATRVTVLVPLSRTYLSRMVPGLGDVSLMEFGDEKSRFVVQNEDGKPVHVRFAHEPAGNELPPPVSRFDLAVDWFSTVPVWRWESPGKKDVTLLYVHTRPSAVLNTIFNTRTDSLSGMLPILLLGVSILFLVVEMGALVTGVSMARTITRAVHGLYNGTQRVIEGDFSHRIAVRGNDQLATLSTSFNAMTQNLEQLLIVSKEKERLQAEIEIAREVQNQLYPKVTPESKSLRLTAICRPARIVSGDYYDYLGLPGGQIALAIGDVAGKGISAALLMATIQSAMRMELRTSRALAAPASRSEMVHLPAAARLVSDLNQQLYATTAPEKYATFFFALYDEATGGLNYTNAGHLPPLLVSKGAAVPLEVTGTVVGAFPLATYEEKQVCMQSGDLLVCYTDGITEPENEYGEMFGEERLIDLITKNADCEDSKIVSLILEAVRLWTSATEPPDDMTLLLARKA